MKSCCLMKLSAVLTAWLALFVFGSGQTVSKVGTTAAPFLKIGVGARMLGMGEAGTTQALDVTALYWNPGALGFVTGNQVILNHYDFVAELDYNFAGIALVLPGMGVMGFQFGYLGAPDIERTTILEQDGTGEMVSASFYELGPSFSRALTDRFSIGGTIKYVRENLWHSKATGVAADIGLLYMSIFRNITIGMSISNFGTTMKMAGRDLLVQHDIDEISDGNNPNINADLATDAFSLPIFFRVGISANFARDFLMLDNHDLIISVDALHPNDNNEYLNAGAEYMLYDLIAVRGGYRQIFLDDSEGGITAGLGIRLGLGGTELAIDYAYADYGRLDYANKFSFIFMF